jgi:histidine triad (HIT) family protein
VYEDDELVVFNDINPQAPLHVLIIPRRHVATLNDIGAGDEGLIGRMVRTAARIAAEKGYAARGYRTVFNCNSEAGQTVFHIHLHLLAGRGLGWPPG